MNLRLVSSRKVPHSVVASRGPGIVEQAASWLRAEASLAIDGPLEAEAVEARLAECRSCAHLDPRPAPQVGWCQACGCRQSGRAELTVKATMPAASCPRGRWSAAQPSPS